MERNKIEVVKIKVFLMIKMGIAWSSITVTVGSNSYTSNKAI